MISTWDDGSLKAGATISLKLGDTVLLPVAHETTVTAAYTLLCYNVVLDTVWSCPPCIGSHGEVLEKNLLNCCVSTLGWWLFGWAFAQAG